MKLFLVLIVLVGVAYYLYTQREPAAPPVAANPAESANTPPAATSKQQPQGFEQVTALLNQDLNGIPADLDARGQSPGNAVSIRRRLTTHEAARPEYQALAQACDLLIQADGQHTSLQQACHAEQTRASFGGSLNGNGAMDHAVSTRNLSHEDPARLVAKAQADIHAKYEQTWGNYRAQTVGKVQGLLASLANKQL